MSVIETITVTDFKNYFVRDFSYLLVWSSETTYNTGTEVYYETNGLFYTCKNYGVTSIPTTTADWDVTSDSIYNYVLDADITKALDEASFNFNEDLFDTEAEIRIAYYYLIAHYLVLDIRRAVDGLESSEQSLVQSRSVGSISENYALPKAYTDDPILNYFTKTSYG
jgi:hypothetical protein